MKKSVFTGEMKKFREKYRLTQKEAAERMGICPQTWSAWESGSLTPAKHRQADLVFQMLKNTPSVETRRAALARGTDCDASKIIVEGVL